MARIKDGTLTAEHRKALEQLWEEAGVWTADTFERLNAQCFASEVPYRGVVWGLTPHGKGLGHTSHSGRITLHPALLNPQSDAWGVSEATFGERYAADVLVHEMIHALFRARGVPFPADKTGEHNTRLWCDEIMRLTPILGLAPIQAAPIYPSRGKKGEPSRVRVAKPGYLARHAIATWPYTLRPKSYYKAGNHKMRVPI